MLRLSLYTHKQTNLRHGHSIGNCELPCGFGPGKGGRVFGAMGGVSCVPFSLVPLQCWGPRGPGSEQRRWGVSCAPRQGPVPGSRERLFVRSRGLEEEGPVDKNSSGSLFFVFFVVFLFCFS